MDDKLKVFDELLQICRLPELTQDLDSVPIEAKEFAKFHEILSSNLPALYDFLQINGHWIYAAEDEETQKMFALLIMLLCELTAQNAIYKLADGHTSLIYVEVLLEKHNHLPEEIVNMVFKNYHSKLQKNVWKRQLGAVHGFLQFLKHLFKDENSKMSVQQMNFCLAVALNVRECHETLYKQMGIKIFQIILRNSEMSDIQASNINGVIYDDVIKDVHFMDSVEDTDAIWQCLLECVQNFKDINPLKWNSADDLLEILLRDIPLAPNSDISLCMLKYVTKLGYHFSCHNMEISKKISDLDLIEVSNMPKLLNICMENNSTFIYRWAKSVLNLFVIEAYKLKQNAVTCQYLLEETMRCFSVYIMPISVEIIEPHLCPFLDKYILLLMDLIPTHYKYKRVFKLVLNFIRLCLLKTSFEVHITLPTYKDALQDLVVALEKVSS